MKFSLRNRPSLKYCYSKPVKEMKAWLDGFENELKQKLRSMDHMTNEYILIQEILGEILEE